MSDLIELQAAGTTKIAGSDSSGSETNYMAVDTNGGLSSAVTYLNFQSTHVVLVASTDTIVTFSTTVKFVRVTNWDILNLILVKNGTIATDTDSTCSRVGIAPILNLSNSESFPITTGSIHIRSAGASTVTVEGFS